MVFEHPGNGHQETVGIGSYIFTFLFGPFYLIYKGAWAAAFLTIFIGAPLLFIIPGYIGRGNPSALLYVYIFCQLLWSSAMFPLIGNSYLKRGWRQIDGKPAPEDTLSDTFPCPRCAETIKRAATVCRFCGHDLTPAPKAAPSAPDQWMCKNCLLNNDVSVSECSACGQPRPVR